jgi:hypothetical protein
MPWGAAAAAVGVVAGSYISGQANKSAAQTQADAARENQQNLLAAGRSAATEFEPYKELGTLGIANQRANNAYFNKQFSNEDLNANLAPNYDFGLRTGATTNLMANNATGGAVGGNALTALNNFGINYAQNAYQNAFNNFQTQRGNIAAQNNNLTQYGLAGATGSANAQIGTATNVAGLGMSAANANAASQIAQGNIYGNAANSLGSIGYGYAQQNMLQNQQYQQGLNNMGGFNSNEIAMGASPGGNFTPTAGNSFTLSPA